VDSRNWFSSINRRRCERAISKRRFFPPYVRRLGTQRAYTSRYPISPETVSCVVPFNNSSAADTFRIATRVTSSIPPAFTSDYDMLARSWSWTSVPPFSISVSFLTYCAIVTSSPEQFNQLAVNFDGGETYIARKNRISLRTSCVIHTTRAASCRKDVNQQQQKHTSRLVPPSWFLLFLGRPTFLLPIGVYSCRKMKSVTNTKVTG
jgi:hypothetical protein